MAIPLKKVTPYGNTLKKVTPPPSTSTLNSTILENRIHYEGLRME